jgi:hypothetical protein
MTTTARPEVPAPTVVRSGPAFTWVVAAAGATHAASAAPSPSDARHQRSADRRPPSRARRIAAMSIFVICIIAA